MDERDASVECVVASSIEVHLRGHIATTRISRRGKCTPGSVVLSRPYTRKRDAGEVWGAHGWFLRPLCRRGGYIIQTKGSEPGGQLRLCKWHLQKLDMFGRTRMCMDSTYMRPSSSLARAHLSNLGVVPSKELGSGGPRPVSGSARVASEGLQRIVVLEADLNRESYVKRWPNGEVESIREVRQRQATLEEEAFTGESEESAEDLVEEEPLDAEEDEENDREEEDEEDEGDSNSGNDDDNDVRVGGIRRRGLLRWKQRCGIRSRGGRRKK